MTERFVILILAVCLALCLAVLALSTAYFLWQWKKLDHILDRFQKENIFQKENYDIAETRESRVISQLKR
ncbi:MAG: hypothetical protein NC416_18595, partial [Eubacterium sp.]|nr:hypothetical protein [Eubacterium sp.]